jgi:cytochrome P450
MKFSASSPDAMPPGFRALSYGAFCWLNRHIIVLRGFGALLRFWPSLGGVISAVARASAVTGVLTRTRSFSNTAHVPNLVAGNFLIAMDPGPTYASDRKLLEDRLACLNVRVDADEEARQRIVELRKLGGKPFDLIEDYLMWVAFRAISPVFGTAASSVAVGAGGDVNDVGLQRQYLLEVRYVAGQLLSGSLSTLRFQRRAELCADSLRARISGLRSAIQKAWGVSSSTDIERNAVGITWVSHPVTVQSAALVVQELLNRPEVYETLRSKAAKIEQPHDLWQDDDFRKCVRDHVLELMRFRPVFPVLARDVPRDTEIETGAHRNARCPGGGKVLILSIAALFDPSVVPDSARFCPHRSWPDEDLRWLMFGYGERRCPAREYAVEILTSVLIGLLAMPELRLAHDDGKAIVYDGPLMSRMRVRFVQ